MSAEEERQAGISSKPIIERPQNNGKNHERLTSKYDASLAEVALNKEMKKKWLSAFHGQV